MNSRIYRAILALAVALMAIAPLRAAESVEAERADPSTPTPPAAATSGEPAKKEQYLPGVTIAQGITEVTGVAISPLLGVSAVGAWRYWRTDSVMRDDLPWFCQPWAWGSGLALLALCFLKDSLGTAVPGVLKKPFDMIELFENKASALVASAAFVPVVAGQMAEQFKAAHPEAAAAPTASIFGSSLAFIDMAWLFVPVSVFAFLMVWICSHAINVLIILSPFSTVDAALKLMRTGLLAMVGVMYAIAPWLAAIACLVIIAVAIWLAPSAMRLAIFGARFAGDILLPWRGKSRATPDKPHAFTLGRIGALPARTGGRVVILDNGSAVFRYRRFCFLEERSIPLPDGSRVLAKGLLSPALFHRPSGGGDETKLLLFLPRYRGREEDMAAPLKVAGVREHALSRGFGAVRGFIGEMLRRKDRTIANS